MCIRDRSCTVLGVWRAVVSKKMRIAAMPNAGIGLRIIDCLRRRHSPPGPCSSMAVVAAFFARAALLDSSA